MKRRKTLALIPALCGLCFLSLSCGGGGPAPAPSAPITLSLSSYTLDVPQDGTPASVNITIGRTPGDSSNVTLSVLGLPAGLTANVNSPATGDSGEITFVAQSAVAGTFPVSVRATAGQSFAIANLSLVVAIVARVGAAVNTTLGANGILDDFFSTSFQPASWSDQFFIDNPQATTTLEALHSRHIRIQALERDIPMTGPDSWDFTRLDGIVNPILSVGDHSPEFQIAVAPTWMDDANGYLPPQDFPAFAQYCANLVRYYNTGGFDAGGKHYQSSSPYPITWWGIFNEPNINGLTAGEYVQLYNQVVPAMQAVDPTIKFVAVELSDFGTEPEKYLPTFVSQVTAQVDAVATHFYSTCNQLDTDQQIFNTIPNFVKDVKYFQSELASSAALTNVPVWVTENNVNADYDKGGGISACNGTPFVLDRRGTSAFFAAWRPYVFSRLSIAGDRALYHWDFNANVQFGEVDDSNDHTYLSYWVDDWLQRDFPTPPGSQILDLTTTESSTVETLATLRNDGTLIVMIANHAVRAPTDNNGPGDPRTVIVDLSAWGNFSSATLLTLDASTNPATAPTPISVTPAPQMRVTIKGYGVAFLALTK
jgi:hypothetical protein